MKKGEEDQRDEKGRREKEVVDVQMYANHQDDGDAKQRQECGNWVKAKWHLQLCCWHKGRAIRMTKRTNFDEPRKNGRGSRFASDILGERLLWGQIVTACKTNATRWDARHYEDERRRSSSRIVRKSSRRKNNSDFSKEKKERNEIAFAKWFDGTKRKK